MGHKGGGRPLGEIVTVRERIPARSNEIRSKDSRELSIARLLAG